MKMYFAEYGKLVQQFRNEPNTMFLIIKPNFSLSYNQFHSQNQEVSQEMYDKYLSRFVEFARTSFGDRLRITDFDLNVKDSKPMLSEGDLQLLEKELDIVRCGELGHACVNVWSRVLRERLLKKGFTIRTMERIDKFTSYNPYLQFNEIPRVTKDSLDIRTAESATKRRKFREQLRRKQAR
jgi:hypothetical protein